MSVLGQFTASSSQFANKHGIYLGRRSTKLHVALYRRTGGKLGGHLPGWPEARIVLVDHTGAKSGTKRTSPLMYHDDGEAIVVVASKAGQPTHPAWFHNLNAHPDTTIQIGSAVREVHARVATDEERCQEPLKMGSRRLTGGAPCDPVHVHARRTRCGKPSKLGRP